MEYAALVVSVDSTLAFLAMPQQFWTSAPFKVVPCSIDAQRQYCLLPLRICVMKAIHVEYFNLSWASRVVLGVEVQL